MICFVVYLNAMECFVLSIFPDADECTTRRDNCHVSALCVNTAGSYYCHCNQSGYTYNGSMCVGLYWEHRFKCFCHSFVTYILLVGALISQAIVTKFFSISFETGLPTVFFFCLTDIDECLQDWDGCDKDKSTCVNTKGSFYCACSNTNFAWNGSRQTCVGKIVIFDFFQIFLTLFWMVFVLTGRALHWLKYPPPSLLTEMLRQS